MAGGFALEYDETSSPLSSTIDRTPQSQRRNPLGFLPPSYNPSSTPAGPPPSEKGLFFDNRSHFSTTPAGPPPSSVYGSSAIGGTKLQFKPSLASSSKKNTRNGKSAPRVSRAANGTSAWINPGPKLDSSTNALGRPFFSSLDQSQNSVDHGESFIGIDDEEEQSELSNFAPFSTVNSFDASTRSQIAAMRSSIPPTSRPQPRKRRTLPKLSELPRTGNGDIITDIAQNLASQTGIASLEEADELIIHTEKSMRSLTGQRRSQTRVDDIFEQPTDILSDLIIFWRNFVYPDTPTTLNTGIGPPENASGFEKANYMASLLLFLQNRPSLGEKFTAQDKNSLASSRRETASIPLILLEWLDNYHLSYKAQFKAMLSTSPNCTAHEYFWEVIRCLVLRGKLREVIHLFEEADFKYAASARDDGAEKAGYHGPQLQAVHSVVNRARQILIGCPSHEGNWETGDDDWNLYRKRVTVEIDHLAEMAEEDWEEDRDEEFKVDNFGTRRAGRTLMKSMTSSANRLPMAIYHSLRSMYSILLGSSEEILGQSQDWLEASTALTIWWDGSKSDGIATWSKNVGRSNVGADIVANDPYLSRLSAAFLCVTDPSDAKSLQINTLSSVEVGLGAVLQGDYMSVLRILQTLSLPIASVVAETGASSGWLKSEVGSQEVLLDQEDLMVLSYASPSSSIRKDDVLSEYAEALFDRPDLHDLGGKVIESWELALSVTSRFDDNLLIKSTTSEFLDRLNLNTRERMDKLVGLCSALGLDEEAHKVCEKFADHLVNNTTNYGTALLCYARSHASDKLQQLMDLLVSYCLVQSKAYPPEEEMDDALRALVTSPKSALGDLIDVDLEAAEMLQFYLVGYACVRRFYNLRDEGVTVATNKTHTIPATGPSARQCLAAKGLLAAISSAADGIYGGLYDPGRQSAIQVDGLLTLLGEATAFLAQPGERPVLTASQLYSLLAAIEDLQTVSPRVYDAADECLQAALRQYHGSRPPSPHMMLKKSMSSGTASNFSFSMMGSEMLAESGTSAGGKSVGSAVLIGDGAGKGSIGNDTERGWDWRDQFKGKGSKGVDVLRFLRLGIARELSLAELDGE